jgi:hypothetical protein
MKLARVWAMDNIKLDLQGIGLQNLDFVQNMYRGGNFQIYG